LFYKRSQKRYNDCQKIRELKMEMSREEQIKELTEYSKKEKRVKQKIRYDAVLLYMEGYKRKEVANIMHMPESTVNYHIRNYEKEGIEGLIIKKQPGQSRKLTEEQEKNLIEIVSTKTPEEEGIGIFANWTSPLICELVKRLFGIQYTARGMRKVLNRLGLSYTRPTYTLEKADKKKQEEFQKEEEMLKKKKTAEWRYQCCFVRR